MMAQCLLCMRIAERRNITSRSMVMMSSAALPLEAIRRNISSAVNIIVQASRLNDGSRKIMNITEVMGMENGQVVLQDIF